MRNKRSPGLDTRSTLSLDEIETGLIGEHILFTAL